MGRSLVVRMIYEISTVACTRLGLENMLGVWNEVMEKVNADFDRKAGRFWAFVGRRTKGKKQNIASLGNEATVTSMKGKLEAFLITIMSNEVE